MKLRLILGVAVGGSHRAASAGPAAAFAASDPAALDTKSTQAATSNDPGRNA